MTTEAFSKAEPIRRIGAFVRWVARTPWPVFTLGMLQSDIIGALFVLGFLRFGLPPEDRIQLQDLPPVNLAVFLSFLFLTFILGAYLFPQLVGAGRFEVLGKYAQARFREGRTAVAFDYDQKTTELNLNYVIRQFNARLMMFYKDTRFDLMKNDFKQFGVGVQVQM